MNNPDSPHDPFIIPTKPWWKSWTIWANALGMLALGVGIVVDNAALLELPDPWVAYLTVGLAIANAALRFKTVQPIDGSPRFTTKELELVSDDGTARAA